MPSAPGNLWLVGEPVGVVLSGGLDSSLVAAIAARVAEPQAWPFRTSAAGLEAAANAWSRARVAKHLGGHHERVYTLVVRSSACSGSTAWRARMNSSPGFPSSTSTRGACAGAPSSLEAHRPERLPKWLLRRAFEGWLPDDLLWRRKGQSREGTGCSTVLAEHFGASVTEEEFERDRQVTNPPPRTREQLAYHRMFAEHLPGVETKDAIGRFIEPQP